MKGNPLETWPDFVEETTRRLQAGQKAYGDASFHRPPDELAREVEEELLDVAAWSFILWTRVRSIREATRSATSTTSEMEAFPGGQR
jgi:hypothetical protein